MLTPQGQRDDKAYYNDFPPADFEIDQFLCRFLFFDEKKWTLVFYFTDQDHLMQTGRFSLWQLAHFTPYTIPSSSYTHYSIRMYCLF